MANTTTGDGNAFGLNPVRRKPMRQGHLRSMDLELQNQDAMFFGSGYALGTYMACMPPPARREFPMANRTWIQELDLELMNQDVLLLGLGRQLTYDWNPPVRTLETNIYYMTNTQQRAPFTGRKSFGGADSNEWSFTVSTGDWSLNGSSD